MNNNQVVAQQEIYYDYARIEELTGRKEFFTNSATIEGNNISILSVKTNSLVRKESCLGHFGLNENTLRIPLLIVTDIMLFAVEIGIKYLFADVIPSHKS